MNTLMLGLVLLGCWRPYDDDQSVDWDRVYLENENLDAPTIVQTYTTSLSCPDGEPAKFYAVYQEDLASDPPVAIVFHSGAYDYVTNQNQADALKGTCVRGESEDGLCRLSRSWASDRVFSTIGMGTTEVDPDEIHTGTLVAALANRGALALYPANCWGDLWHNEQGHQNNDYSGDEFYRNGRTMAWWMIRILIDSTFAQEQGLALPVPVTVDAAQGLPVLSLLGLGDGGRAVSELLWRLADDSLYSSSELAILPNVYSVLLDSTPDDLTVYENGSSASLAYDAEGLDRLFYADVNTVDYYSLRKYIYSAAFKTDGPERIAMVYSSGDRQIDPLSTQSLAVLLDYMKNDPSQSATYGDRVEIQDRLATGHVFTNNDLTLARGVVGFLLP